MVDVQKLFNQNEAHETGLQKKKNKLAKSAWKFSKTNKLQLYRYLFDIRQMQKLQGLQRVKNIKNSLIINSINYMHTYTFHLGNCFVKKRFYFFTIKSKSLEFLKFKKPFYFRSKKK